VFLTLAAALFGLSLLFYGPAFIDQRWLTGYMVSIDYVIFSVGTCAVVVIGSAIAGFYKGMSVLFRQHSAEPPNKSLERTREP